MHITFKENTSLDLSFLEEELITLDELRLVNPSAGLPFDVEYWLNFFHSAYKSSSLLFYIEEEEIGHVALRKEKEGSEVFLCFLYLKKSYRGKGLASKIMEQTEQYAKENYSVSDLNLNVLSENIVAKKLYQRNGYEVIQTLEDRFQMSKPL